MTIPKNWIEHRRDGDNELLGWIVPEGEGFSTIDLLGRQQKPTDWVSAERRLEGQGIGYLSEVYAYWISPNKWIRVRLIEVSTGGIMIMEDNYGDATVKMPRYHLPFPVGSNLIPLSQVIEE